MSELLRFLQLVAALKPLLSRAQARIDAERRLPGPVLDALHRAGLFRLLLPAPYGGGEITPPAFFEIIEAVAKIDASTAWCLCQANGCAMAAAYLKPSAAQAIWGQDPAAVVAWGPGKGEMVATDGGYRLSGNWSFASGGRHATWLGAHTTIREADGAERRNPDGSPMIRTLLFPAAQAELTDIWNVIGLRGTASDAYAVRDLFVPAEFYLARDNADERHYQGSLYHFPAMSLYAAGFSGTALGIARSMLDGFQALASDKTPRLARQRLADNGAVQAEFARAEARLRAARAYVADELALIWRSVCDNDELTVEQRMRIRLAATFAIHEAKSVANVAYDLAGATAIFNDGPFERRFRDIHTVTQQLQGRSSHFQTVGAYLFGHPADLTVA